MIPARPLAFILVLALLALPAAVPPFFVTLMSHIGIKHARRARPRASHRHWRHDVLRPGGVCRHCRLHDRLADNRARLVAMAWPCFCAGTHSRQRAGHRRHHPPARRAFPAALDHRLGPVDLLRVRQSGAAWPSQRPAQHSADHAGSHFLHVPDRDVLSDLVRGAACHALQPQPPGFA